MSQWFRMYTEVLDDPKVQRMSGETFKAQLLAAMCGEENEFSRYIRPGRDRPSGPVWQAYRDQVFQRDDFTCTYCGLRGVRLECDHIVPVARGGSNDLKNLTTACRTCNRAKRDKLVSEWR